MENKLNRMLNKYESAGAVLLDRTDVRRRKLNAAGEVPKRAQKNQYIFAA